MLPPLFTFFLSVQKHVCSCCLFPASEDLVNEPTLDSVLCLQVSHHRYAMVGVNIDMMACLTYLSLHKIWSRLAIRFLSDAARCKWRLFGW